jgi:hypothetical protein
LTLATNTSVVRARRHEGENSLMRNSAADRTTALAAFLTGKIVFETA